MAKKLSPRVIAISTISVSLALIGLGSFTLAWFNGPNVEANDKFLDGEIGLRNYFYQGDGSEEKPYEIVNPIHYYNLTRLQNLGVFPEKTYFQVGSVFDVEGVACLRCINRYDDQGNPIYEDFLDMGTFSSQYDVHSIGGEFAPFVSEINGNGIPIRNLKVLGNPEDVGVFGYVASSGIVKNMVFDNLEVTSLGYNNNHTKNDYLLFSQDIEDIFHSTSYLATDVSLTLYDHNATTDDYDATNLKKLNGSTGTQIVDVNSNDNVISGTKYFNGYFKPTFPNIENDPFTYSMISSSSVIVPVGDLGIQGSSPDNFTFDFTPLFDSIDFNKQQEYQFNTKIYLVASTKVDGVAFSRVVQSYTIEIYSNSHRYEDGQYSVAIFCDYVDQGSGNDKVTGYHHGVNVGLLAGHVDGSMQDCYVFNGRTNFNETGFHPVYAETDTALVGEVGKNVKNNIDPDIGLVVHGDIGIMNFSKIYSLIRSDATPNTNIMAGRKYPEGSTSMQSFISYKNFLNQSSFSMFSEYLRYADEHKDDYEYITATGTNVGNGTWHTYKTPGTVPADFNTVDFLWNNVVEDSENVDRGLGVFKIVSSYNLNAKNDPGHYGTYMLSNIGQCKIVNNASSPKEKVIFSTAEYDHTKDNEGLTWDSVLEDIPKRGATLPSYSDVLSFEYPFSRDFDYCFELDLTKIDQAQGNDYMYNTDSAFLTNYLSSILIDKYGDPVTPGSARFGFMFRSSENEFLPALTSYMPVGKPGNKHAFDSEGTTKYYPSNSIVFNIENKKGANISVVGNNDDITVYSLDPDSPAQDITPLYTMHSKNRNETDMGRYFTYDVKTGATGTEAVEAGNSMGDSGVAYGHIFKLKQGHYVLGARSGTANIYFLAVQGQTDGTIGAKEILTLDDKIDNVDFLLTAPTLDDFQGSLEKALFYYKGVFNNTSGTITHDVYIAGDKKYMRITFNNGSAFVMSMHLKSRKAEHIFMFNGQLLDIDEYDYVA